MRVRKASFALISVKLLRVFLGAKRLSFLREICSTLLFAYLGSYVMIIYTRILYSIIDVLDSPERK